MVDESGHFNPLLIAVGVARLTIILAIQDDLDPRRSPAHLRSHNDFASVLILIEERCGLRLQRKDAPLEMLEAWGRPLAEPAPSFGEDGKVGLAERNDLGDP